MKLLNYILIASFSIFLCTSCYYDIEEELYPGFNINCDTVNVKFSVDVFPVIQNQCYACHGNGTISGSVNLDGYDQIKMFALNGYLVKAIEHSDPQNVTPMPYQLPKLPDCIISKIRNWALQGAPNN